MFYVKLLFVLSLRMLFGDCYWFNPKPSGLPVKPVSDYKIIKEKGFQ
jgi:hypothetical protein